MRLLEAILKSKRVITAKTESRKPIKRYVEIIKGKDELPSIAWIRTPKGIYCFSSSRREINSKDDYVVSIVRESYNGNREHVSNIMTNDLKVLENWLRDRKKSIIDKDFKDRKYIMPRYWI